MFNAKHRFTHARMVCMNAVHCNCIADVCDIRQDVCDMASGNAVPSIYLTRQASFFS